MPAGEGGVFVRVRVRVSSFEFRVRVRVSSMPGVAGSRLTCGSLLQDKYKIRNGQERNTIKI